MTDAAYFVENLPQRLRDAVEKTHSRPPAPLPLSPPLESSHLESHHPNPKDSGSWKQRFIYLFLEQLMGWRSIRDGYQRSDKCIGTNVFQRILSSISVTCDILEEDRKKVPQNGPLVVVANHPFGTLDGLLLGALLGDVRNDFRVIANHWLLLFPKLAPYILPVEVTDHHTPVESNLNTLRSSLHWLRQGRVLLAFPAGEVAHFRWRSGAVEESPWSSGVVRLAMRTGASILPVHIEGTNRYRFHLAGLIHPRLRTALLPREMMAKQDTRIRLRIGQPIRPTHWAQVPQPKALTAMLRSRCLNLHKHPYVESREDFVRSTKESSPHAQKSTHQQRLEAEIDALGKERRLASIRGVDAFFARGEEIPNLMDEIGRLREATFRKAGEGTGEEKDIDRFDDYYTQLFTWDREKGQLVGAYRLASVAEVIRNHGLKGLYTHSLFHFNHDYVDAIGTSIELGRSFIRFEYQRNPTGLFLLWKGIGAWLARNPQHHTMFGAVSISKRYSERSREVMSEYLSNCLGAPALAKLVTPRCPFSTLDSNHFDNHTSDRRSLTVRDISKVISEIEHDGKGLPVLIELYVKLGGRFLGFNLDPDFSDVLDGLVVVDLRQTSKAILARYMGREQSTNFLQHHGIDGEERRRAYYANAV